MSTSLLSHCHSINGFEHIAYDFEENKIINRIIRKKNKFSCSKCKSPNVTATKVNERNVKLLPMGKLKCVAQVTMHRLRCHDCKAYLMERLEFLSTPHSHLSKSFERTLMELRPHMSIQALADYFDLHWETVKKIEKRLLEKKYSSILLKDVKVIGVDEVFLGKSLGDKGYLTIVRDLKSGAVLFVGKGKSAETLEPFMQKLKRSKAEIEAVAIDMSAAFTSWVQENLPKALIVYDHFHVIKLMNDKLNQVRRRTMNELQQDEKKN